MTTPDLPKMPGTGTMIEHYIAERVLAAFGDTQALKDQLRPIVRELVLELLPVAIQAELPQLLFHIDHALAQSIETQGSGG